ncbi:hypothetical protein Patl1_17103 [Pistacia atlantica]|uniref:Uncharacterized protein n=1 Tax=Pistacia atlantica TaxID=434234 RepID=A0ACC1B9M5_9ROSI|nr:hypothetical protein Patl1_17103 [Pistacia atlantica]
MGESFVQGVPKLEELRIRGCKDITFKGMESRQDISSLHGLAPERCSQVLSTVAEGEEKQLQQRLPCRLHNLELRDCENLAKLPQTLHNLTSLTDISIKNCSNLVSFTEVVGLPSQLRSITIENCKARGVEALVHSSMTALESFKISDCESVKYIARVQLPPNVKRLDIKYCNNLQTLVDNEVSEMLEEKNQLVRDAGRAKEFSVVQAVHQLLCIRMFIYVGFFGIFVPSYVFSLHISLDMDMSFLVNFVFFI